MGKQIYFLKDLYILQQLNSFIHNMIAVNNIQMIIIIKKKKPKFIDMIMKFVELNFALSKFIRSHTATQTITYQFWEHDCPAVIRVRHKKPQ